MTDRLAGKSATVTGAGSRQGREATVWFAAEGARVLACDVDTDAVERLAAEVGDVVAATHCDVSSSESVQAAVVLTEDRLGGVSVLLNSAGIDLTGGLGDSPAADLDEAVFDRTLWVNLRGTFLMVKYVLQLLRREGRSTVNIASVSGVVMCSSQHAYATSRGGVVGLTHTLARVVAQAAAEGPEAAVRLGYPVVVKGRSPHIPHRAEHGGDRRAQRRPPPRARRRWTESTWSR